MEIKYKEIKWTQNLYSGGYFTYWKLYGELISLMLSSTKLLLTTESRFAIFLSWLDLLTIKLIWACILKPLGKIVSRKIVIEGKYSVHNEEIYLGTLTRSVTYKLLSIPVWKLNSKSFTNEEINDLKK